MPRIRPLCLLPLALASSLLAPFAAAQGAPAPELKTVAKSTLRYVVRVPAGYAAGKWVPMLVVFAGEPGEAPAQAAAARVAPVVDAGFVAVAPVLGDAPDLGPLFRELRRTFRIEQGGMHAFLENDAPGAAQLLAQRHEFQSVSLLAPGGGAERVALTRLPARRVGITPQVSAALPEFFTLLHRQRELAGAAGEVARVLDDFHDAAANADEDRYFAILPDDAVFLGTDGTERWTGKQFRRDYTKYFERDSAWTYVTLRRDVNVEPGDTIAWFDETLDNEAYGECRGSGVLMKRDGRWVLRQYHLTVPVPNDVTRDVAARIRAFQDRVPLATTTVVVVRHAEKADDGRDPELSDAGHARAEALARTLRDVPLAAVYTSEFRRTAQTVAPITRGRGIAHQALPAKDAAGLVRRLRDEHRGKTVLVCGHSNTVPALLEELGIAKPDAIGDDEYDRLYVVTLVAGGPRVLTLRYGP